MNECTVCKGLGWYHDPAIVCHHCRGKGVPCDKAKEDWDYEDDPPVSDEEYDKAADMYFGVYSSKDEP